LDFPRHDKINAIAQAFEKSQTVIIHAASGQGKSALAYRYLHEHFAENYRFSIELIEGPHHAFQIATALDGLDGHASVLKVPIIIYVDIRPNDTSWPILVYRLSRNPYLKILVTIREEEF
jgi:GTPase SAR1 family protein